MASESLLALTMAFVTLVIPLTATNGTIGHQMSPLGLLLPALHYPYCNSRSVTMVVALLVVPLTALPVVPPRALLVTRVVTVEVPNDEFLVTMIALALSSTGIHVCMIPTFTNQKVEFITFIFNTYI